MLVFLITLLYGCNAVSLHKFNTSPDGNVTTMSMLETIKADPKKFVSEVENLDPQALSNVIGLLEDLLLSSQSREDHLVGNLNNANNALDAANSDVLGALDDLTDAQARTAAAIAAVAVAQDALTAAQNEQTLAESAEATVEADLEGKRQVHTEKETEQGDAQTAHDDEIDSLNNEQQVLQEVIDMLNGLPDATPQGWQLVASVGPDTKINTAFWNNICGNFDDLTVADTILVEMGQVKDYFHPGGSMSLCHFLLNQDYTWSAFEDGTYVRPDKYRYHHGPHFGGSRVHWPTNIDGRSYLSFWGSGDGRSGGCCHDTSTNYGGSADGVQWHRSFDLSVKYV